MISVIFSSFNGEKTLSLTLNAFCNLTVPDGGWKLIVVDNGSTDRSAAIMQTYRDRLPMQLLTVLKRGKNNALNEAINYIEGDLVVFTDDDVIPESEWLCKLQNCARLHPDYGLFGGPILPRWPRKPESWILAQVPMGMVYAISDPNLKEGPVDEGWIWGPNMAVKKSLFDEGLRFDNSVGPDGTPIYAMGSEYEFTKRLAKMGVKSWFCAEARVEHIIRENQLSRKWILQRFFRHGRGLYCIGPVTEDSTARILGVERWLYKRMLLSYLKAMILSLLGFHDRSFIFLQTYYRTKGMIYQSRISNTKDRVKS